MNNTNNDYIAYANLISSKRYHSYKFELLQGIYTKVSHTRCTVSTVSFKRKKVNNIQTPFNMQNSHANAVNAQMPFPFL